ncbi:MAG: HAMP domain-containing histidine kinase [Gammaproteobacteria bacterium]|nr:HAMP domain-containing histidine kinase [Gammaproteobacteria bacterium]
MSSLIVIRLKPLLQFQQQIMASALLVYHILIWSDIDTKLQLALTSILYGLFLLWQPLWSKDVRVSQIPAGMLVILLVSAAYFFPNESLVFFGLMLSGLIGSRLLNQTSLRSFDLLSLLIIIIEMAIGLVPSTFPQITLPGQLGEYMQTLVLIPVLLFFFAPNPGKKSQGHSQVDLMHGLLAGTLISIVLLGGIVANLLYGVDYIDGLLLAVFIVSTLTLGISWFWNPGVGYSGLGVLWNRYAMTIGGPFETWISTLTALIEERYLTPAEYLTTACEQLVENDWLNGIQWNFESYRTFAGEKTGPRIDYSFSKNTNVELYYKSSPGQALEQHTVLLIRMAYQFYLAKLNQEKVRAQEHFATIHHTGARLTHDIKNILQSIKTSLNILDYNSDVQTHYALLKNTLGQVNTRLEQTLNKLKAPTLDSKYRLLRCQQWMTELESSYQADAHIAISTDIENDALIPAELFDSVVGNLINNALRKQSTTRIDVRLLAAEDIIVLSVCDDGKAIPGNIEADLFQQPVSSGSGMGIGLYQSAIMASAFNFELELSQNQHGRVCFNLFQPQDQAG